MSPAQAALDHVAQALDAARVARPATTSPAARRLFAEALTALYAAREALEGALRADGQPVTYLVTRSDGTVTHVAIPSGAGL